MKLPYKAKAFKVYLAFLVAFIPTFFAINYFVLFEAPSGVSAATFAELDFVISPGSTEGNESGNEVVADTSGNIYLTGSFSDTVDFDEDNIVSGDTVVANALQDAFVAKYNSAGVLQWVKAFGGNSSDVGRGLAVDSSGNVYVGGFVNSSDAIDFDTDNVVSGDTLTKSAASADIFLGKYNSSGVLQWVKLLGASSNNALENLEVDSSGNVYTSGSFSGTMDFDEDNVVSGDSPTSSGGRDAYLAKYNTSGVLQWVKPIGGGSDDFGYGVDVDSSGNVYAAGYFQTSSVDFDVDNVVSGDTPANLGSYDIYGAKYNSSGVLQWVVTPGGTGFDGGLSVGVDGSGNMYLGGIHQGTADFDEDNVTAGDTHTSAGSNDIFIAKYDSSGDYLWVNAIGGTSLDQLNDLAVNSTSGVLITGRFQSSSVDFDENNTITGDTISPNSTDPYIANYNENGVLNWVKAPASTAFTVEVGESVFIDGSNNIYLSGVFRGTTDFDPDDTISGDTDTPLDSNGDIFMAKYTPYTATKIENLNGSLSATDVATSMSAEDYDQAYATGTRTIRIDDGGFVIADVDTNMSSDLDWSSVTGGVNVGAGMAFAHNITSAPGTAATFTLYVPKLAAHDKVTICPGADDLGDLVPSCPGAFDRTVADGDTSIVNLGGQDYWAITGLTGTGGFGGSETNAASVYIDLDAQPATAPSTISSAPEVPVSTTDQFYLSYVTSSTEFGIGDIIDVAIPFDWTGLAVCSSPADADGDAGNDHTVALVGSQQIRYTFTAVTTTATTTGVELCFEAQTPAVPGNYSISSSDDNDGDFGAALVYVGDDNDVTITATVPSTLSLRIKDSTTTADTNLCDLGVLNPASVNSCAYRLAPGTNSPNGVEVYIVADDQLNTTTPTTDIDDVAGGDTVTAGNEEHGILLTLGTPFVAGGSFTETTDEPVPLVETLIIDAAAAVSDSLEANWTTVTHSASVNSSTNAGAYDQIVTYRAWIGT